MSIQKLTDSISKSLPDIIYVFTLCLFDFFPMCRRLEILFAYKIFFFPTNAKCNSFTYICDSHYSGSKWKGEEKEQIF